MNIHLQNLQAHLSQPLRQFSNWHNFHLSYNANSYILNKQNEVIALNLHANNLTDTQIQSVWQCTKLQILNLSDNDLNNINIPYDFQELRILDVSDNKNLQQLSFAAALPNMETLDLSDCKVEQLILPGSFEQLKYLDASRNKMKYIDFQGDFKALEWLDLSGNAIDRLEFSGDFSKLEHLYLYDSQIKEFYVAQPLPSLRILHLSKNQLEELPANFLTYTALETLYLHQNPLSSIPPENLPDGEWDNALENVRNYLRSLAEDETIPNDEVKLVLLGNSTAGKSSLLKYLEERVYDKKGQPSTHGIVNKIWQPKDLNFKVNVWDFGGQEFYHATHRLFLSANSVTLVVFESSTDFQGEQEMDILLYYQGELQQHKMTIEHFPYQYWLDSLRYFCQKQHTRAIVLVQSKMDREKSNRPKRISDAVKKKYELEATIYPISVSKTSEGERKFVRKFEDFEEDLMEILAATKASYPFSKKWLKIKNDLRKRAQKQSRMTWQQYVTFCEKRKPGISQVRAGEQLSMLDTLTDYLRNISVILYYPEIEALKNIVFIHPQWVTNTIYKVLDYKVHEEEGQFDRAHVAEVVGESDADQIIALMKQFELIFSVKNQSDVFVAPQYLPKSLLVKTYNKIRQKAKHHLFTLFYPDFMPKSVMARFIARYGNLADDYYWKKGIDFMLDDEAFLVENSGERTIEVWSVQQYSTDEPLSQAVLIFNDLWNISRQKMEIQVKVEETGFVEIRELMGEHPENVKVAGVDGKWYDRAAFDFLLPQSAMRHSGKRAQKTRLSEIERRGLEEQYLLLMKKSEFFSKEMLITSSIDEKFNIMTKLEDMKEEMDEIRKKLKNG